MYLLIISFILFLIYLINLLLSFLINLNIFKYKITCLFIIIHIGINQLKMILLNNIKY